MAGWPALQSCELYERVVGGQYFFVTGTYIAYDIIVRLHVVLISVKLFFECMRLLCKCPDIYLQEVPYGLFMLFYIFSSMTKGFC